MPPRPTPCRLSGPWSGEQTALGREEWPQKLPELYSVQICEQEFHPEPVKGNQMCPVSPMPGCPCSWGGGGGLRKEPEKRGGHFHGLWGARLAALVPWARVRGSPRPHHLMSGRPGSQGHPPLHPQPWPGLHSCWCLKPRGLGWSSENKNKPTESFPPPAPTHLGWLLSPARST